MNIRNIFSEEDFREQAQKDGITHIATGVAVLRDGKILMVRRVADDYLGGVYELPGGGVDQDETITEGAIREAREETGLIVSRVIARFAGFDYSTDRKPKVRQVNFLVEVEPGDIALNPDEHDAYVWVDQNNMSSMEMTDNMKTCIEDAMKTGIIASMNQDINDTAKKIADNLIELSAKLADKMDRWSDIVVGEGSLQNTERAGFVNKTSADKGIDLVVDIHALNDSSEATLRTWALDSVMKDDGSKVFNNIQLTFSVPYDKARQLTERFDRVTRDDLRSALHDADTTLQSVVICNQSALTQTEKTLQGKYYDVSADEIIEQHIAGEVLDTLKTVLESLQNAADAETS